MVRPAFGPVRLPFLVLLLGSALLLSDARRAEAGDTTPAAAVSTTAAPPAAPIRERLPAPADTAAPRSARDDRNEVLGTVVRVIPGATAVLPAELDGHRGDVTIFRGAIDVEGRRQLSSTTALVYGLGYERSSYEFSDPDALVPGDGRLLEDAEIWRLSPGFLLRLPSGWGAAASVDFRSGRAVGADFEDTLTYGLTGGLRIPIGRFAISVGAQWQSSLSGGGFLSPILGLSGGLSTGSLHVYARGSGLVLSYDLSDRFAVGVSARYEAREFRLAKDDRIPEGIVADVRVPITVDVEWRPSSRVSLTLSGGASAYTEFRFEDKDGDKIRYLEADPSPTISLYLTVKF